MYLIDVEGVICFYCTGCLIILIYTHTKTIILIENKGTVC